MNATYLPRTKTEAPTVPGPDTGDEFTDPVAHLVRTLPTVYRYGPAPADLVDRAPSLVRLLGGVAPAPGGQPRTERQAFYERAISASELLTSVVEAVGGVDGASLRIMMRMAETDPNRRPRTLDQRREAAGALRKVRGETFQRNYEPRLTLAFAMALYTAVDRREITVPRGSDTAERPPPLPATTYAPRDGWTPTVLPPHARPDPAAPWAEPARRHRTALPPAKPPAGRPSSQSPGTVPTGPPTAPPPRPVPPKPKAPVRLRTPTRPDEAPIPSLGAAETEPPARRRHARQ